jgi:hypothetical protein
MTHIPHNQIASVGQIRANTFLIQQVLDNLGGQIDSNRVKGNDRQRQLNDAKKHRDSIENKVESNIKKLIGVGNLSGLQTQLNNAKLHRDSIESKVESLFSGKSDITHGHAGENIINQLKGALVGGGTASIILIGVGAFLVLRNKGIKRILK